MITSLLWLFGITALGLLLFLAWAAWKELYQSRDAHIRPDDTERRADGE